MSVNQISLVGNVYDAEDKNAVHFTEQSLTDAQKAQARANIGAVDASSIPTGTVRYDAPQSLTSSEKTQARANLDVNTATVSGSTLIISNASAADAEITEIVTGQTPVIQAVKNHRYICQDDLTSLSFTPCVSGLCEVVFHSSTNNILTVTGAVMPDWWTATEGGYTYEMSFADRFGAVMAWTTPS